MWWERNLDRPSFGTSSMICNSNYLTPRLKGTSFLIGINISLGQRRVWMSYGLLIYTLRIQCYSLLLFLWHTLLFTSCEIWLALKKLTSSLAIPCFSQIFLPFPCRYFTWAVGEYGCHGHRFRLHHFSKWFQVWWRRSEIVDNARETCKWGQEGNIWI